MKRIFNYNTGKLYESDGTYTIAVNERPLSNQVVVDPEDESVEFEQKFYSYDEALDAVDAAVDELCNSEGFSRDDADIKEIENGFLVTVPDYKEWEFVISGDVDESSKETKSSSVNEEKKPNESVSSNFSRLRSLFEEAGLNEKDEEEKKDDEKSEDEKSDDEKKDDENSDDEKSDEDDSQEMKAVIITVKKGDEDKCKEELIDAGVDEDDIDVLAEKDDDDETVDIRIDVNSVMELKDYLDKKGIDLEEEIGGEIVDDSDDSDDSDDEGEKKSDEEGDDEEADFDFNDLGDLFGADESEE